MELISRYLLWTKAGFLMEAIKQQIPAIEIHGYNEYERKYNDVTTLASEMLDGSMQTNFEYEFDSIKGELYAMDGSSIGEIFKKAVDDAEIISAKDPRLKCEIRRRKLEMGEYQEMVEMAKGIGPNTMVVTSDAPAELEEWGQDVGGYNFKRKQTMLRVISRLDDGKIRVTSQTLDKSDRSGLESIHRMLGHEPECGELLGQRIRVDKNPDEQDALADDLIKTYDQALEDKYQTEFYAGRTPSDRDNTYQFVCRQHDLIDEFMAGDESDESLLGLIAALENRWNRRKSEKGTASASFIDINSSISVQEEIRFMAEMASAQGKTYSGCGVTISAKNSLEAQGYGNNPDTNSNSNEDCEFISKKCPKCHTKNVRTKVTKNKITGSCGCEVHKN